MLFLNSRPLSSRLSAILRRGMLMVATLMLTVVVACAGQTDSVGDLPPEEFAAAEATITGTPLAPEITGNVALTETADGLAMAGTFLNVPIGMHGFHIHESGSCADDGAAAGGHYNPKDVEHGYLPSAGFEAAHAGDLGNVQVTSTTKETEWSLTVPGLSLTDGEYAVADLAFILHADPDDLSQPTGNAGARIACGVIQSSGQSLSQSLGRSPGQSPG